MTSFQSSLSSLGSSQSSSSSFSSSNAKLSIIIVIAGQLPVFVVILFVNLVLLFVVDEVRFVFPLLLIFLLLLASLGLEQV